MHIDRLSEKRHQSVSASIKGLTEPGVDVGGAAQDAALPHALYFSNLTKRDYRLNNKCVRHSAPPAAKKTFNYTKTAGRTRPEMKLQITFTFVVLLTTNG